MGIDLNCNNVMLSQWKTSYVPDSSCQTWGLNRIYNAYHLKMWYQQTTQLGRMGLNHWTPRYQPQIGKQCRIPWFFNLLLGSHLQPIWEAQGNQDRFRFHWFRSGVFLQVGNSVSWCIFLLLHIQFRLFVWSILEGKCVDLSRNSHRTYGT